MQDRPRRNAAMRIAALLACLLAYGAEEYQLTAWVTAYCPCGKCCRGSNDGKTSTGKVVRYRDGTVPMPACWGIAAPIGPFPPRTSIYVPGYSPSQFYPSAAFWPVDDTGGALQRRYDTHGTIHLDVRFIHHSSARRWPTGWYTVTIHIPD